MAERRRQDRLRRRQRLRRQRAAAAAGLAAVVVVVVAGLLLSSHHAAAPHRPAPGSSSGASRSTPRPRRPPAFTPAAVADRLSAAQLAGQRVIVAYSGLEPPRALLTAVRAGEVGGVIFFSSNISSPAQLAAVARRLQRASLAGPLHDHLLLMTDQEGGEVRRLPGAPVPSEKDIGESPDGTAAAAAAGASAGGNLAAAGVNVNLAPVLDVYRQAGDFIDQFARSYSSSPATAGTLASRFIAAQQRRGVAATAKHFPGLGAAASDENTDLRPVTLDVSLPTLRSVDEAPYRRAIAVGVRLVMASWATYPALDPRAPAGLSPTVLQGELRHRLGFRGVTITDALGAGALARYGSLEHRAVLAARAGDDLILSTTPGPEGDSVLQALDVVHALAAAIAQGRISRAAARASAARILALRAAL